MGKIGVEQEGNGQGGPESPSRRELTSRTNAVFKVFAESVLKELRPMVRNWEAMRSMGSGDMGSVQDRPGEIEHILDTAAERILVNVIKSDKLPVHLKGEHNESEVLGTGVETLLYINQDPVDNTRPVVELGLDGTAYSVAAGYDKRGNPLAAVTVDIKNNLIYYSKNGRNFLRDMEQDPDSGKFKDGIEIFADRRADITDRDVVIASFVGEKEYSLPFFDLFRLMIEARDRKAHLHTGGGSFIYSQMARGVVHAYVMVNEPRTEIDPGLPFAIAAKCTIVSVDPDTGQKTPYKYDPSKWNDSVPLFIAATTPELCDTIIGFYMEGKRRMEEQTAALDLYRELRMKPGEEYHLTEYLRAMRKQEGYPPIVPQSPAS